MKKNGRKNLSDRARSVPSAEPLRALIDHIEFWRRWAQTATRDRIRAKHIKSIAVMRVHGPTLCPLFVSARTHGLVDVADQPFIDAALDEWEQSSLATRLGVLSYLDALIGAVLDGAALGSGAVLQDCAELIGFLGRLTQTPMGRC